LNLPEFLEYDLTFFLLVVCIAFFGYLAYRSKNLRSFQLQISVFILIWTVGELANVLISNDMIFLPRSMYELGYEIHLGSMIFFGVFLYSRYYYSNKRGRQLIENVEIEDYNPGSERKSDYNNFQDVSSSEKKS
jgi:hypothetical protein